MFHTEMKGVPNVEQNKFNSVGVFLEGLKKPNCLTRWKKDHYAWCGGYKKQDKARKIFFGIDSAEFSFSDLSK